VASLIADSQSFKTLKLAKDIRRNSLLMVHSAHASHIASALSIADIVAVLYGDIMNWSLNSRWAHRDRFILSKGHSCVAVYSALAEIGMIDKNSLATYGADFSTLMNHISHKVPGVEFSTGALGHGLPFAVGKALFAKMTNANWRTFVILSDGEMDEGSNWEALLFAAHQKIGNLFAIIDYNKLQSLGSVANTLGLEPLVDKLKAFGARVDEIDGHNHEQLRNALKHDAYQQPKVVIAHTTKGRGVSFMENSVEWHYKSPDDQQLLAALLEIDQENA
jgi:transketolase